MGVRGQKKKISEGRLLELLRIVEKHCSWFPSLGTLDYTVLLYFAFILFPWLSQSNMWPIINPCTLPASWEICMQVMKQQLEPDMEQWTSSK